MEISHCRKLLAVTAALVGSLVIAAPAAAKSKEATFKVEIFAKQDSDWTRDHTDYGACGGGDVHVYGSGGQTFSVTTKKPVKVTALYSKGEGYKSVYFSVEADGSSDLPVNGAALREGTNTVEHIGGGDCAGGGDGPPPPPPDCGERSFKSVLRFDYYFPETYPPDSEITPLGPVLSPSGPFDPTGYSTVADLYETCPLDTAGDRLALTPKGDFPLNKLFGKETSFAVKAKDSQTIDLPDSGFHEVIKTKWRVDFKRLRPPQ